MGIFVDIGVDDVWFGYEPVFDFLFGFENRGKGESGQIFVQKNKHR